MRKVILIASLIIVIVSITQFSTLIEIASAAGGSEAEFEAVSEVLNQIESGRSALAQMTQYGVEVKLETGGGTYYQASDNRLVIDGSNGAQRASLSFIHEMTHARYHNEGLRVDFGESDQAHYVEGRIEEEAEGVVASIEAKKELAKAGFDVSQVHYPLETAYSEAYQSATKAAQARERGITAAELESIGQAAGMARVIQGFEDGQVLGSKSLSPYSDVYGDCWSRANTAANLVSILDIVLSQEATAELLQSAYDYVSGTC